MARIATIAIIMFLSLPACSGPSPQEAEKTPDTAVGPTPTNDVGSTGGGDTAGQSEVVPGGAETSSDIYSETLPKDTSAETTPADHGTHAAETDSGGPDEAPEPPDETELKVVITAPESNTVIEEEGSLTFIGVVTDSWFDTEDLQVAWATGDGDVVLETTPGIAGWTQVEVSFDAPGTHSITLTATTPNGQSATASVEIGVCTWGEPETFTEDLTGQDWTVYGDAFWEPQGWLEMTGNLQSKKGAIFNTGAFVNPGDVTISFSIWTGEGINSGADGFAMSVVNVTTAEALETFIEDANAGGCLGYGVSGPCGSTVLDAFHVEFDTWHNGGDPNTDPTPGNHVAITLNGDPGDHLLWADMPQVENSGSWHDVEIDIDGSTVTVHMDGSLKLTGTIPNFLFHGGFIGFSGTTGWASNYHRFDNLHVKQGCLVPEEGLIDP